MKLSYVVSLASVGAGVSLVALAMAMGEGCSSKAVAPVSAGIVPPARPTNAATTTSTTAANFAIHELFLGDTDRMGNLDPNAWATYGYNIDGKISTRSSTDVCTAFTVADHENGHGGIDNAFGNRILPLIMGSAMVSTATLTNSIQSGGFTVMFDIVGLTSDAAQTAVGMSGQLFTGGKYSANPTKKPSWQPSDNWPVDAELLADRMDVSKGSLVKFGNSYVANGTWVNGDPSDVQLTLNVSGQPLAITVHHAIITFDHTAPDHAANGTIGGVLTTEELVTALKPIAASFNVCGGGFDQIAMVVRQASDIMKNGTNDPGAACDGVSIGLGFTADRIGEPMTIAPTPPVACDKCSANCVANTPDGGADAGLDASGPDAGMTADSGNPNDSGPAADAPVGQDAASE